MPVRAAWSCPVTRLLQHLILGWCVSQRDLEVVRKMLQQICVAYAPEGGTKVRRGGSSGSSSSCDYFSSRRRMQATRWGCRKYCVIACHTAALLVRS